jgi:hypothetical protein
MMMTFNCSFRKKMKGSRYQRSRSFCVESVAESDLALSKAELRRYDQDARRPNRTLNSLSKVAEVALASGDANARPWACFRTAWRVCVFITAVPIHQGKSALLSYPKRYEIDPERYETPLFIWEILFHT